MSKCIDKAMHGGMSPDIPKLIVIENMLVKGCIVSHARSGIRHYTVSMVDAWHCTNDDIIDTRAQSRS